MAAPTSPTQVTNQPTTAQAVTAASPVVPTTAQGANQLPTTTISKTEKVASEGMKSVVDTVQSTNNNNIRSTTAGTVEAPSSNTVSATSVTAQALPNNNNAVGAAPGITQPGLWYSLVISFNEMAAKISQLFDDFVEKHFRSNPNTYIPACTAATAREMTKIKVEIAERKEIKTNFDTLGIADPNELFEDDKPVLPICYFNATRSKATHCAKVQREITEKAAKVERKRARPFVSLIAAEQSDSTVTTSAPQTILAQTANTPQIHQQADSEVTVQAVKMQTSMSQSNNENTGMGLGISTRTNTHEMVHATDSGDTMQRTNATTLVTAETQSGAPASVTIATPAPQTTDTQTQDQADSNLTRQSMRKKTKKATFSDSNEPGMFTQAAGVSAVALVAAATIANAMEPGSVGRMATQATAKVRNSLPSKESVAYVVDNVTHTIIDAREYLLSLRVKTIASSAMNTAGGMIAGVYGKLPRLNFVLPLERN